MIDISESAQTHFRKLIEREAVPGMGVRLAARDPGTARPDVRLVFAAPAALRGEECALALEGYPLCLDPERAPPPTCTQPAHPAPAPDTPRPTTAPQHTAIAPPPT